MKRSRAFILSEQLMTIMLQASFIIVLCASFYQLISFYTRTQQVLTARNHAERVISFMDEKIRNAGLGMWRCKSSSAIREKFNINMFNRWENPQRAYKLPIAIQRGFKNGVTPQFATNQDYIPELSLRQNSGDIVTVLYARRDLSSGTQYQFISHTNAPLTLTKKDSHWESDLRLLDTSSLSKLSSFFTLNLPGNIKSYAVMASWGYPVSLAKPSNYSVRAYGLPASPSQEEITIPAASELLGLNCMQMLVQNTSYGRQFAYRELIADNTNNSGTAWYKTYNQEEKILDIYMEVDRDKNIFKLWVLATGGYDASMNNPRPDSWPKEANPQGKTDSAAKTAWLASDYCHHIVYVSRAQWKLNNIPQGFIWN